MMIEEFTKAWFANLGKVREKFADKHPEDYKAVVRAVVEMLSESCDEYSWPDPGRIHQIDDGDYQGTLVFVIGAKGYQPDRYWYVKVGYGSCSGCDTLEHIRGYDSEPPTLAQVEQYMTLALHVLQGMKEMGEETV
jgi:hypothetical protein